MVREYDPLDVSNLLINYFGKLYSKPKTLSMAECRQFIVHWIVHSPSTSHAYNLFKSLPFKPTIRLKKVCPTQQDYQQYPIDKYDEQFPSYVQKNEIILCTKLIRNKISLKEHLDRELTYLYHKALLEEAEKTKERKPQGIRSVFERATSFQNQDYEQKMFEAIHKGCQSGYDNYFVSDKVKQKMIKICSRRLYWRRSGAQIPIDLRYRFAGKLAEETI